ncbi:mannan endo-1,6-alpha-mannosidase [Exophiala viscosa]|uniref:Mannan endo-1,6-alpha-mannosidase n=1 Tax=Exophiala viscosa TaxID=2486360 RepID=A0AAN6E4N3_9EURO|nr:mannan endo-1,6-alpha-mannosidase [Exophiala viscosa]KAI1626908.1 mannan endo-1,6-alpha-mannosidase [Exophiala viscosa]
MKPFRRRSIQCILPLALLGTQCVNAVSLDLSDTDSIKSASKIIADEMVSYYTGYRPGDVAGNLPSPYYWWEAGAMFGSLIDYWYFTGDDTYNNITTQAILHQTGSDNDFMPPNQTKTEGNDDQSFWGMAALSAAENNFPNPSSDEPQWLALAQAVFNTQAARWDTSTCAGGLRWQIFTFNSGYNYKNTISNGCFFNIGSRLAVYTGNQTYADWAEKAWDWVSAIGLRDADYNFYDGSDDTINCSQIDHDQWTYNAGTFLIGAANMYNFTNGSSVWEERLNGIIGNLKVFLKNDIMYEAACEAAGTCDTDQQSFKAYLARWIAAAIVKAPFTYDSLKPILEASATAAAATCTGGTNGTSCGNKWYTGSYDGTTGVGEQMSALEVIQSNLLTVVAAPVTEDSGGTSKGDSSAGSTSDIDQSDLDKSVVTTKDRAGAALLTVLICFVMIGGALWIMI